MKKYITLLYVTFSVMSFAQFTDNVFDQNQTATGQQSANANSSNQAEANPNTYTPNEVDQSASIGVPGPGDQEEAPGNPGEPVPINDYIPWLLVAAISFIVYYKRLDKNINI